MTDDSGMPEIDDTLTIQDRVRIMAEVVADLETALSDKPESADLHADLATALEGLMFDVTKTLVPMSVEQRVAHLGHVYADLVQFFEDDPDDINLLGAVARTLGVDALELADEFDGGCTCDDDDDTGEGGIVTV